MLEDTVAVTDTVGEFVLVTEVVGVLVAVTDVVAVLVPVTEVVGVVVPVDVKETGVEVGEKVNPTLTEGLGEEVVVGKHDKSEKGREILRNAEFPLALTTLPRVWKRVL